MFVALDRGLGLKKNSTQYVWFGLNGWVSCTFKKRSVKLVPSFAPERNCANAFPSFEGGKIGPFVANGNAKQDRTTPHAANPRLRSQYLAHLFEPVASKL
jgi:hypothetical protein